MKFGRSLLNALFRGFVRLMPSLRQFDVCVELKDVRVQVVRTDFGAKDRNYITLALSWREDLADFKPK